MIANKEFKKSPSSIYTTGRPVNVFPLSLRVMPLAL
jgi:hypothetical protein